MQRLTAGSRRIRQGPIHVQGDGGWGPDDPRIRDHRQELPHARGFYLSKLSGDLGADVIASAGGDRITDVDSDALEGIAVIGVDDTYGTWQYSTDTL